ncbi:MAG: hypothetical protein BYD32DRAFT_37127 [Podila humilis]|nr:MAG: hypothetical protein BYD32DRAFT_37127 [Podila humilis]
MNGPASWTRAMMLTDTVAEWCLPTTASTTKYESSSHYSGSLTGQQGKKPTIAFFRYFQITFATKGGEGRIRTRQPWVRQGETTGGRHGWMRDFPFFSPNATHTRMQYIHSWEYLVFFTGCCCYRGSLVFFPSFVYPYPMLAFACGAWVTFFFFVLFLLHQSQSSRNAISILFSSFSKAWSVPKKPHLVISEASTEYTIVSQIEFLLFFLFGYRPMVNSNGVHMHTPIEFSLSCGQ